MKYWIPASVAALAATELTLRTFGFGTPVLSQTDTETGYRFQPNQKINRFGKNIEYNQYSQRSEPITPEKPQRKIRILMTGDSVLNGGNPTDQSNIITELFENKLTKSNHPAEVLNASAGSWGIGNQQGYLRKFGTFNSNAVILQIGTHDLLQPTSTGEKIGKSPNAPTQAPLLGLQEAVTRYALPKVTKILKLNSPPAEIPQLKQTNQQFQQNIESLKAIINQIRKQNIPVFVLFTPNREDLLPTFQTPEYKTQFIQLLNSLQVPVIDTHTAWEKLPTTTVKTYFRDGVHLSVTGNQAAANLLYEKLCVEKELVVCSDVESTTDRNRLIQKATTASNSSYH